MWPPRLIHWFRKATIWWYRLFPYRKRYPRSKVVGSKGEWLAAKFLRRAGYKVLGTRKKVAGVEIDLIAQKGSDLVLVEVKTRQWTDPVDTYAQVETIQARRLRRVARAVARRVGSVYPRVRVELIVVRLGEAGQVEVRHFPDSLEGS